jgi:hypothetical protein
LTLKSVFKLATVLTKSQIRGYQRGYQSKRTLAKIFGDPRTIFFVDVALLVGLAALGYYMLASIVPAEFQDSLRQVEGQGLAGVPTIMAFSVILFGILSEISQPVQSISTDLVNWLPISPGEYVAGSALSLSYTYSFMLSFFLGISLGPAIYFDSFSIWTVSALMSITSLFIGACAVELLRALTNRISSSFYKKSGRSGIIVRLLLTIIVLVIFQLLFSGPIVTYLLKQLTQTVRATWFVPVIWPSMTVLSFSDGTILSSIGFGFLSIAFLAALFVMAVEFRALYWTPVPVSIKLSNQAYRPATQSRRWLGLSIAESAIVHKDWRSLTRRREMARFLAIPFVLAISMGVSFLPLGNGTVSDQLAFALLFMYLTPIALFSVFLSMTSLGQEGYAVWHLYVAPLSPRQLFKAKFLLAALLGVAFDFGLLLVLSLLMKPAITILFALVPVGLIVVLEESTFGVYFGARFPDFRETIRSRFVTVWGSVGGMGISWSLAILTAVPLFVSVHLFGSVTIPLLIVSMIIGVIVSLYEWRLAEREIRVLLKNIQV